MRARLLTRSQYGMPLFFCAVFVFLILPISFIQAKIIVPPSSPTPDINLSLSIDSNPIENNSTVNIPTDAVLPVSISFSAVPGGTADWSSGGYNALDGSINSQTYVYSFYLDFYKGTLFSDATFISGEQMNLDGPTLKTNSTVSFPGPGTYSAVLYGTPYFRDYATMCPEIGSCFIPPYTLDRIRTGIARGPDFGVPPSQFYGIVTFTIPADPCVATNTCASNVMFLPGIEGSRLYEDMPCASGVCETKLWEPSGDTLALRLAHNADGTSANADIYEKKNGVIDNAYFPVKGNIYKSFIEQMNGLVTAKTIKEWEAIPYDWRLTPEQILTSGAQIAPDKISYLVATSSPFIIQELRRLASSSKTGKVTIIAHSNGGLVTKALIEKLGPEATNLVDKIIFVAVPQAGTPLAIGALLHGYGQGLPVALFPYALSDGAARTLATNMPMTYNLLPSATYFTQVDTPVVTFTNQPFLAPFRDRYGDSIHSRERLHTFLVDPWRLASSTTEGLNYPSVGNESLLTQAEMLHTDLDAWTPPSGITLYEIAGWGEKTLAGIDYYQGVTINCDQILSVIYRCTRTPKIDYHPRIVLDGDGTVVTPSALWTPGANRYWVDLRDYNGFFGMTNHGNILEIQELRTFIQNLLTNNASTTLPQYISTSTPMNPNQDTELHFTLHSPLTLNLYDDHGRHTGVSTTTGELEENIPGSRYMKFGEVQFISAPSSIHTQLIMNGFAAGSFTLDAEETNGNTVVASTTFAGIPSAATAVVKMDVPSGGLANMGVLTVDESGNGHSDIILQPKAGNTVLLDITPPEIQIAFSTTTKAIAFIGIDDSGTTTMTTPTIYPTFKKIQKEKERENHGIAITTVTARDDTGNTTILTYSKPSSDSDDSRDNIILTSVSYNGIKSDLSKTSLRYEWDMNKKGRYTMFVAQLKTASSTVEAQYQSKKNLTVITTLPRRSGDNGDDDETGSHAIQSKLPGLVIPRMQTENGSVKIIY